MKKQIDVKRDLENLYKNIQGVLIEARQNAYRAINFSMVKAYWEIGRVIVEEEQKGKKRADYGEYLIKNLSKELTKDFGKGFSPQSLRNIRQFYKLFRKSSALRSELTWTHYKLLIRIENEDARGYYLNEAVDQNWSTRALNRQINSFYYERILASKNNLEVIKEAQDKTKLLNNKPEDFVKDPYVLEFLNMKPDMKYIEKDVEQGLIDKLQQFLLELGKGFSFIARQKRISTETKNFYIDLVFYNYLLKCFVLIDLKTEELTHQDIGQMDMYVRIYEDKIKQKDDNPTIGIILCTEKDDAVVKYSVLKENKRLFASKYKMYLPTEKELKDELIRERNLIEQEKRSK